MDNPGADRDEEKFKSARRPKAKLLEPSSNYPTWNWADYGCRWSGLWDGQAIVNHGGSAAQHPMAPYSRAMAESANEESFPPGVRASRSAGTCMRDAPRPERHGCSDAIIGSVAGVLIDVGPCTTTKSPQLARGGQSFHGCGSQAQEVTTNCRQNVMTNPFHSWSSSAAPHPGPERPEVRTKKPVTTLRAD